MMQRRRAPNLVEVIAVAESVRLLQIEVGSSAAWRFVSASSMSGPFMTTDHYQLHCEPGVYTITANEVTLSHERPGPSGSHASIDDKGRVRNEMAGVPPHGRDGEEEVAERLVRRLNVDGASWGPVKREVEHDHTDLSATDRSGAKLKIQVTRIANQARWAALGRKGHLQETLDYTTVAAELFDTIKKKAEAYGTHERRELTLAVDVTRLPSHTFDRVIGDLEGRAAGMRVFGFRSIWVVGSRDDLVFRVFPQPSVSAPGTTTAP